MLNTWLDLWHLDLSHVTFYVLFFSLRQSTLRCYFGFLTNVQPPSFIHLMALTLINNSCLNHHLLSFKMIFSSSFIPSIFKSLYSSVEKFYFINRQHLVTLTYSCYWKDRKKMFNSVSFLTNFESNIAPKSDKWVFLAFIFIFWASLCTHGFWVCFNHSFCF